MIRAMKQIDIFIVLLLLCSNAQCVSTERPHGSAATVLKGHIIDIHGSFISEADISIKRGGHSVLVHSDRYGQYSLELTAGKYTIEVTHPGFCQARRSSFYLSNGTTVDIDVRLLVCARQHQMRLDGQGRVTGEVEGYPEPYTHEELDGDWEHGLKPTLLYGERKKTASSVTEYRGPKHDGAQLPARLTFDLLDVESDLIYLDSQSRSIVCEGSVSWSDGHSHQSASKITVELKNRRWSVRADN
jgi:hypothetical protein